MQYQSIRKKYQSQIESKTQTQSQTQASQKPKLIKKTQLTRTTLSNPNKLNNMNQNIIFQESTNEELTYSTNKKTKNLNNPKENKAEFLLKTIFKAFYLSTWKRKISAMKYFSRAYNPRRINFKKLITQISLALKQHKFGYFNEIYSNMDSLPMPKNIKHDIYFGTIRIVNKEVLKKKNSDKMTMLENNKNENKVEGIKTEKIETKKTMNEEEQLKEQKDKKIEISKYEKYKPNSNININEKTNKENINNNNIITTKDYTRQNINQPVNNKIIN